MKETLKVSLLSEYAQLLLEHSCDYRKLKSGTDSIINIEIDTDSDVFSRIGSIDKMLFEKYKSGLFTSWTFCRNYTHQELNSARLFQINIRKWFNDSCGKEHGTVYDHSYACPICHSGERQVSPLHLPKGRYMLHRDVIITLGYEVVVSKRFADMCKASNLKGLTFGPVYFGKTLSQEYFQLMEEGTTLEVSPETKFGVDPWNYSEKGPTLQFNNELLSLWKDGIEIYKCPKGDNLGLNILSEAYVKDSSVISEYDFFISRQTYGVYRGLAVPHHLLFCSPIMRQLIIDNNIKGFDFEIAHVV